MAENQVSMVNTRGRVVWIEESKIVDLRDQGWRMIVNPKELYYPQYDQSQGKVKEDEVGGATKVIENADQSNPLGIIVI